MAPYPLPLAPHKVSALACSSSPQHGADSGLIKAQWTLETGMAFKFQYV